MAVDMFLKLDGIKGESVVDKHKDEIDVLSWSWGMTQSGNTHTAKGSGAGKVDVQDLHIVKHVDKSSPVLMKHACDGTHIKSGTLTVRKAGGKAPVDYFVIKLTDILVSSVSVSGAQGGDDLIGESLSLNFGKFEVDYTPQKADGSADAAVTTTWNIAENKP